MASITHTTSLFLAKLLEPVSGVFDPAAAVDFGLADECAEIREAQQKVEAITAQRDACCWGSRDRAVQQIALDWWASELRSLTGGLC